MTDVLTRALQLAAAAFDGCTRKSGDTPAVMHAMETAVIVASMTSDREVIAAAALHDVVEDAGITADQLEQQFGPRVRQLVMAETEDKRRGTPAEQTWRQRKQEAIDLLQATDDRAVQMIFLGDKLSNIRSLQSSLRSRGPAVWDDFNQHDPEQHHWYHRSIANALRPLSGYPAWQEYDRLIASVFMEKQ